jgi:molybdopterin converting factor small subunit
MNLEFIDVELELPATVQQLKRSISAQFDPLVTFVELGRIAVRNEFVNDGYTIDSEAIQPSIALIPPVSGG